MQENSFIPYFIEIVEKFFQNMQNENWERICSIEKKMSGSTSLWILDQIYWIK